MITTTLEDVLAHLPVLHENDSKFDRGHLLLIAGSFGMAGAAIMACRAAFKAGAGYVTAVVPERIYPVFTASCPEAVCIVYDEADLPNLFMKLEKAMKRADAVVTGPGLGENREKICGYVFTSCEKKLLIDADGLTALSRFSGRISAREVVLTPHSGEAGRLLGSSHTEVDADRERSVKEISEKYAAVTLLKGRNTLICKNAEAIAVNPTGNPGMAKAGSGDVLSGIIGAFLAGGMNAFDAARFGAFVHGKAGDLAAEKYGMRSMGPMDIIEMIGTVINE